MGVIFLCKGMIIGVRERITDVYVGKPDFTVVYEMSLPGEFQYIFGIHTFEILSFV